VGRTLVLVLGRIVIDTYDRADGGLTPPPDIFLGPESRSQGSNGARSARDNR
jgi:hypothetical protein